MIIAVMLMALAWCALTGTLTLANAAFGALLGYLALKVARVRPIAFGKEMRRIPLAVGLGAFVVWALIVASLRMAVLVIGPRKNFRPGVIAVPLDLTSETGIGLLADLITLTPGTLSVELSPDWRTLYVHVMPLTDADAERRKIKESFERRVRGLYP